MHITAVYSDVNFFVLLCFFCHEHSISSQIFNKTSRNETSNAVYFVQGASSLWALLAHVVIIVLDFTSRKIVFEVEFVKAH